MPSGPPPFAADLRSVLAELQAALLELIVAAGSEPSRPQQVSRHFGLDKTLAWKVARLATAIDPVASLPLVPGESGIEILLRAAAKIEGTADAINRVRAAVADFDRLVRVHAEDRATLELMASELLQPAERAERDEAARRLAFQGNSAILGVRARARLATYFVARSNLDPTRVDLAFIGGLVGFRRLRVDSRTPIFQRQAYRDDGSPVLSRGDPLIPSRSNSPGIPLLNEFCRPTNPPIRALETPQGGEVYELTEGPVGRSHSADCVYGMVERGSASAYRDQVDRFGEHATRVFTPVEAAQIDLLVDRSVGFRMPPEARLQSMLTGSLSPPFDWEGDRLPLHESPAALGCGLSGLASPLMDRYREMIGAGIAAAGWDADQFEAWRLVVRYPPTPSLILLRYPLLQR